MNGAIIEFRGDFEFLSNFYPAEIRLADGIYPSVEHAYQAEKTRDPAARAAIRNEPRPGGAKRLGHNLSRRDDWSKVRDDVMFELLTAKFAHIALQRRLIVTGDAMLVEGNTWGDSYWGVSGGVGLNVLGRMLMSVRKAARESLYANGHVEIDPPCVTCHAQIEYDYGHRKFIHLSIAEDSDHKAHICTDWLAGTCKHAA